jgi:hypothetical protein
MRRDGCNDASFISASGDRVTIHFPRKNDFLFQQSTQSGRRIEEPKRGSLKDFEVCGISKKEPPQNGQKAINSINTIVCPQ